MTIYKTAPGEKKVDKFHVNGEIITVTEPLTGLTEVDDIETSTAPRAVRVTYNPRRTRTMVNLCLIVAFLLVLGVGLIGAVYLYKYLSGRVLEGRCGVSYIDEMYGRESNDLSENGRPLSSNLRYFEEEVEVSEIDQYETLKVPEFDDCEKTIVWHDFSVNYTALVDSHLQACFIMKLNRTLIAPPKDVSDLVHKIINGYYMPSAEVVRENYRQVLPPVADMTKFGLFIMRQCYYYDTYMLVKMVPGVYKRSVDNLKMDIDLKADIDYMEKQNNTIKEAHQYGFSTFKNTVVKMKIIPSQYFEEEVEVSEIDQYETLKVPEFDDCEKTIVWHDFSVNYTALVDSHLQACFIMKLNRTLIAPPKDVSDLVHKIINGYYMPSAEVVRENYRQVLPPVADMTKFGLFIMRQCYYYDTYMLVKMVPGVYKRSVDNLKMDIDLKADIDYMEKQNNTIKEAHQYGFSTFKNTVVKMKIIPSQ